MKKIKSIQHLKTERERLDEHKENLESAIAGDWRAIRETIRPRNLVKEILSDRVKKEKGSRVAIFVNRLIQSAKKKIARLF